MDYFEREITAMERCVTPTDFFTWQSDLEDRFIPTAFKLLMQLYVKSDSGSKHPLPYNPDDFEMHYKNYMPRAREIHARKQAEYAARFPTETSDGLTNRL